MLIINERQTENDIIYYKQHYQRIDDLSKYSANKLDKTKKTIMEYISKHKCYLSISWGKDSVLLGSIVSGLKIKIPFIWIKEMPMYNPDCETIRDIFLKNYYVYSYHEFNCDYGKMPYINFCDKNGNPSLFYDIANICRKNFGARITGIRNDESGKRKTRFLKYGFSTENTCAPLSLWNINEVFAYIHHNNLPLHPAYGMVIGGLYNRNAIRVDCVGGFEGNGIGRDLWEKTYYQDILNKMCV